MRITKVELVITDRNTLVCGDAESPLGPVPEAAAIMANPAAELAELRRLGDSLGALLTTGPAGESFLTAREGVLRANRRWTKTRLGDEPILRVSLDIRRAELRSLPWEIARHEGAPLFTQRACTFVRAASVELDEARRTPRPPIRLFAISGTDSAAIAARSEIRELRHQLKAYAHLFDIEVFHAASSKNPLADLQKRISEFEPHILHFAGHAYDDPPALQLGSLAGGWTAAAAGQFFANEPWALQLVYLNACRTQEAAAAADSFVNAFCTRAAADALLAMTGNIQGHEAGRLAGHFYAELALGAPVDQALASARARLGDETRASFYPALTVTSTPAPLIPPAPATVAAHLDTLAKRDEAHTFVDRVQPRRQLISALTANRAQAVIGDSENGKSWFLRSCLRCIAYQGHAVLYLELPKYKNWSDALRALIHGGDEPILGPPLPSARVAEMDRILSGDLVASGRLPDAIRHTLEALRPPEGQPATVLILDHLGASELSASIATDAETVFRYFFRDLANNPVDPNLRLIVACANKTLLDTHAPSGSWSEIHLQPFPSEELKELTRDWFQSVAPGKLETLEAYLVAPMQKPRPPRFFVAKCREILEDMS